MQETERPHPKFKVGQVVVMNSLKRQIPFRILGAIWSDGWFYQWNRKNWACESMVRELTDEESGGT
jgi:hypothetical protein